LGFRASPAALGFWRRDSGLLIDQLPSQFWSSLQLQRSSRYLSRTKNDEIKRERVACGLRTLIQERKLRDLGETRGGVS
jgi:hypothetical protein